MFPQHGNFFQSPLIVNYTHLLLILRCTSFLIQTVTTWRMKQIHSLSPSSNGLTMWLVALWTVSVIYAVLSYLFWKLLWMSTPLPLQPPHHMSSARLLSVKYFSQRINLIREMRNVETKENSQRRPNNINVVIKHRKGPSAPSQRL